MKENQKTKLCKHCKTEIPAGAKICPNCKKKQGGVVKWIIIGVVAIAVIGSAAGKSGSDSPSGAQSASNSASSAPETSPSVSEETTAEPAPEVTAEPEATPQTSSAESEPEENIPTEYKSALKSAEAYSKIMHMSKTGIYDQLTSEYGDKFSAEAAQYAVDNLEADWNENALASAQFPNYFIC